MKTYTLKTDVAEVIDYNNIEVESSESVVVPETTETKTETYTLGTVKQQMINVDDQIAVLVTKQIELKDLYKLIVTEANKVKGAIK